MLRRQEIVSRRLADNSIEITAATVCPLAARSSGTRFCNRLHRLTPAAAVAAATAEYRTDSDLIDGWLTENLRRAPGATADAAKVYDDYCKWAEEENIRPMSRPALTRRLADKGITAERRKVNGVLTKLYVGIELPF